MKIHVENADLTKEQCLALIDAYRSRAGKDGQVSVQNASKISGKSPWCVDNMDGIEIR